MGANAVNAGDKVSLDQLDALYTRLYNLRNAHANHEAQINASNIAAAQPTSGLNVGSKVEVATAKIDLLKQELKNLANSQWYQSNTEGTIVKMTDFSGNFSAPAVGDLLEAKNFNLIESTITTAEGILPGYSSKYSSQYSNYTNYTNYTNYSNYSNYTNYTNYSNYSNYTNYTNYSNYSNYTNYSNYGSKYSNYGSKYGKSNYAGKNAI